MDKNTILQLMTSHADDPQDAVFVVSFPKAGRTWLRVLLSRYKQLYMGVNEFYLKFHAVYTLEPERIPQYVFYHGHSDEVERGSLLQKMLGVKPPSPEFDVSFCTGSRIIFLMRDPKDTIVSFYHQIKHRQKVYKGDIQNFIRDESLGIERLIKFMNFVAEKKDTFDHMFVYYEDLHKNTAYEFTRIIEYAGIPVNREFLQDAIEFASFSNMKKMEQTGEHGNKLKALIKGNPDTYKVRKGKVGSYQDELTTDDISYLDHKIRMEMHPFFERYISLVR